MNIRNLVAIALITVLSLLAVPDLRAQPREAPGTRPPTQQALSRLSVAQLRALALNRIARLIALIRARIAADARYASLTPRAKSQLVLSILASRGIPITGLNADTLAQLTDLAIARTIVGGIRGATATATLLTVIAATNLGGDPLAGASSTADEGGTGEADGGTEEAEEELSIDQIAQVVAADPSFTVPLPDTF